jgi:sugar lactone lactonase YvrE
MGMIGRKGDAAGDLALPKGVAIDREGNVWVVDAHFENVQIYSSTGQLLLAVGQEGNKPGEFWLPAGMCIDRQNRVWIADTYNRRVQVFELIGS